MDDRRFKVTIVHTRNYMDTRSGFGEFVRDVSALSPFAACAIAGANFGAVTLGHDDMRILDVSCVEVSP